MRYLALHNNDVEFNQDLGQLLAGYPNLEELYLAPFQTSGQDKPFVFSQLLQPCLQSLRLLALNLFNPTGFVSPVRSQGFFLLKEAALNCRTI